MAVPKRKVSKSRARKRRTHYKTGAPSISKCPQCGEPVLPHHVCQECGTYKGRSLIEPAE